MVNHSLIHDAEDLKYWCFFIRSLNYHLVNRKNAPKKDMVCYRGSKMTDVQASGFTSGSVLRLCMFLAMSTSKDVAQMYTGEAGYMLEVHVPRGCRNACLISHLSGIENEKEVLMPPYSPILVKGHRREERYKIIEVEVLDGRMLNGVETRACLC